MAKDDLDRRLTPHALNTGDSSPFSSIFWLRVFPLTSIVQGPPSASQRKKGWASGDVKFKNILAQDIWKINEMEIVSLTPDLEYLIQQAAQILVDAFKVHSPEA